MYTRHLQTKSHYARHSCQFLTRTRTVQKFYVCDVSDNVEMLHSLT